VDLRAGLLRKITISEDVTSTVQLVVNDFFSSYIDNSIGKQFSNIGRHFKILTTIEKQDKAILVRGRGGP
jgi:hypothetical protein